MIQTLDYSKILATSISCIIDYKDPKIAKKLYEKLLKF